MGGSCSSATSSRRPTSRRPGRSVSGSRRTRSRTTCSCPGTSSDETLAALYSGAAAVVIPSLAEGFGLPAVEAAACGAPLVLSDLPAHHETMNGSALYFEPTDREALVRRLREILAEPRDLGERARQAVRHLTWDAAAERLHELLSDAAAPTVRERR